MSEQESGGDRGAGRTARSRRDAQQGARCAGQWGAVRRAGGAGRQGSLAVWPEAYLEAAARPRQSRAVPAQSATRRVARPQQGESDTNAERPSPRCSAQLRTQQTLRKLAH